VHTSMDGIHLAIVEQDHGTVVNSLPPDKSAAQLKTKLGSPNDSQEGYGLCWTKSNLVWSIHDDRQALSFRPRVGLPHTLDDVTKGYLDTSYIG
jgi:hypothetical protein